MASREAPHGVSSFPVMRPLGATDPRVVAGYQLRARLGAGGMGSVYLSYSPGGQPVAIKVVRDELADDPEFRRRFEAEVQAARRVQGVYTVPVVDSSTEGSPLWLATAYVPGPSLADVVRAHGPLPLPTVLLMVAGIAEALQSIHSAGVIHRDLKPGNVLLAADGPKVIDFGIARAADATSLTGTDVRVGTPSYMAPEQITGNSASPAADIFTLGLNAHYAATGKHPFGEGAGHAVMFRIVQEAPELDAAPGALRGLIGACLAKEPSARPTPAQVIEVCRALSPGQTLQREESWLPPALASEVTQRLRVNPPPAPAMPSPPTPTSSARPGGGRRTALLLTATAVAAAILGGTVAAQVLGDGGGSADPSRDEQADDGGQDESERQVVPSPAGSDQTVESGSEGSESTGGTNEATGGEDTGVEEDSAYTLTNSDVEVDIVAPIFERDTEDVLNDRCAQGNATTVDLDDLTVQTNEPSFLPPDGDIEFQYVYCDHPNIEGNGIEFNPQVFVGIVDDPNVTPEQCYEAAHAPTVPHVIPVEDIWEDETLREDMGLCVETSDKNVVLLWFTRVTADPLNQDLRTYLATATQWQPND